MKTKTYRQEIIKVLCGETSTVLYESPEMQLKCAVKGLGYRMCCYTCKSRERMTNWLLSFNRIRGVEKIKDFAKVEEIL